MAATEHVEIQATAPDDRRRDVRYRIEEPCLVADATAVYDCIVADISVGGALLEGQLALSVGSEIAIGFDSVMGILGEVMHCGDGFVGVRFTGDASQRALLVAWLRKRLRSQIRTARARVKP